jgi:hypothetical protein
MPMPVDHHYLAVPNEFRESLSSPNLDRQFAMVGGHVPLTFVCLVQLYFISSRDLTRSIGSRGSGDAAHPLPRCRRRQRLIAR